ncbi:putative N-ethylmaleimide reductase [Metarhizium brunneum]
MASSNLFKPLAIGNITLKHRLALAPLTRFRASDKYVPLPITQKKEAYVAAAKNAITASFNGIKLSSANRYLIDQFLQDVSNQRDDKYGGSIKNRSRFTVEVTAAIAQAIRPKRIGVRLSPWNTFNAMKMADPVPQFSDVIAKLGRLNLAYLHLVDPRVKGNDIIETKKKNTESLEFAYKLWKGLLLIACGFKPEIARQLVDEQYPRKKIIVAFGRAFTSTPDLPYRVRNRLELTEYNRDAFYKAKDPVGYIDYPFSQEFIYSLEGQAVEVVLS